VGGLFFTHPICSHSYAGALPLYLESWPDLLPGRVRREAVASGADVGCNRARGGENAGQPGDINRGLRLLPLVSRLNALGPTWFLAAYGLAFFLLP
jgi:hypothetical protein